MKEWELCTKQSQNSCLNKKELKLTLERELKLLGYELVEFKFSSFKKETKLSLFVDILGSKEQKCSLSVKECSKISKSIAAFIDKNSILGLETYYLEVSTPGLERKLNTIADFERFTGKTCKVKYNELGKHKFAIANIIATRADYIIFELQDGKTLELLYKDIETARLRY